MKIGIVVLSVGAYGKKGLYNTQEIGLGKELAAMGHLVQIYKCVTKTEELMPEEQLAENLSIHYVSSTCFGNNAFPALENIDSTIERLLCFSDIQLYVPNVYRWCKQHKIVFIPYVGTVASTSTNKFIRGLINLHAKRIFSIYQRNGVLVKTRAIQDDLRARGVTHSKVAPVGLDFSLLKQNAMEMSCSDYKQNLGFSQDSKVVLLVGRIEADRNPLDSVAVFKKLHQIDPKYKLLVVGKGSLAVQLFDSLAQEKLDKAVVHIPQVPNSEMWKIYRISDLLISFSKTEIFGMSLLEAMYYGTTVHVVEAPGPNDIVVTGETGYLYQSSAEMAQTISTNLIQSEIMKKKAFERVIQEFTWYHTAKFVEEFNNRT